MPVRDKVAANLHGTLIIHQRTQARRDAEVVPAAFVGGVEAHEEADHRNSLRTDRVEQRTKICVFVRERLCWLLACCEPVVTGPNTLLPERRLAAIMICRAMCSEQGNKQERIAGHSLLRADNLNVASTNEMPFRVGHGS